MNERNLANTDKDTFRQDEARARRFVRAVSFTRCVLGPVVLFGLLLGSAYWDPSSEPAQYAHAPGHVEYFTAGYVNAASTIEDHVQAF